MTLYDLTGHESGIVVFSDSEVAVVNWLEMGENRMPIFGPAGMLIAWPEEDDVFEGVSTYDVENIADELPGSIWLTDETDEDGNRIADTDLVIYQDDFGDLSHIFLDEEPTGGRVFVLADGRKIIAPLLWD